MTRSIRLNTYSSEQTQSIGCVIGENARPGDVYLLSGPLGAGKTCLTQGLARGLGVEGYVRSPTFVLMTRHHGRLTLHHIDLLSHRQPRRGMGLGPGRAAFRQRRLCDRVG